MIEYGHICLLIFAQGTWKENFKKKLLKDVKREFLANMDIDELSKVKGLGVDSLMKWKMQAKSLLDEKAIRIKEYLFPAGKGIYFDIEDTEVDGKKIVYLFGLIFKGKYYSFVASKPSEEGKIWKEFLKFFSGIDHFKIYVYSHHEKTMMKKLFAKYRL